MTTGRLSQAPVPLEAAITLVSNICNHQLPPVPYGTEVSLWCDTILYRAIALSGEGHAADMNVAMRDIIMEENRWVSLLQIDSDSDTATVVHNLIGRHVDIMRSITFNVRPNVTKGEQCVQYNVVAVT